MALLALLGTGLIAAAFIEAASGADLLMGLRDSESRFEGNSLFTQGMGRNDSNTSDWTGNSSGVWSWLSVV